MKKTTWILTLALAAGACSTGESAPVNTIQTADASTGDLRITVEATGAIEPIRTIEVKSLAGGEVLELLVDVGDEVAPGQLLARVDPRDVQNSYDQAKADLEVAQARLDISRAQLDRNQELLQAGVITQQEYESASLDFANAQSSLVRAQTNFDLAEIRLNDVTIRAPQAGTILTRTVEEGSIIQSAAQNVSGGTTLFTMAALESMRVRTMVDETDMGDLRAEMSANVTVEAYPGRNFAGRVQKIEPQAETVQNVTMFPVIVVLDNSSGLLKSGMNAEVEILIDQAVDVILVPNNTVVTMQDVMPAALALGLDPETMDMSAFRRGGRPGAGAQQAATSNAAPAGGAAGDETPSSAGGQGAGAEGAPNQARMDTLRAKVERGEISRDSLRSIMAAARTGAGAGAPTAGTGAAAAAGMGGTMAMRAGATSRGAPRAAVVFVMAQGGTPEPRMVQIGLNDWDNTQVISGLEPGEVVAVIGAAQLQAQQAEMIERMRSRMGGGGPLGGRR